jgi:hypothetical protein
VADHPLRPATDRRLGEPLPHQLANRTSAAPIAQGPFRSPAFLSRGHAVLASLSTGYPPQQDTFRCITHPFATRHQGCPRAAVRLACVKHAASVQSEPGSNSSVQSKKLAKNCCRSQTPRPKSQGSNLFHYRASTSISLHVPNRTRPAQSLPPSRPKRLQDTHTSAHTYRL